MFAAPGQPRQQRLVEMRSERTDPASSAASSACKQADSGIKGLRAWHLCNLYWSAANYPREPSVAEEKLHHRFVGGQHRRDLRGGKHARIGERGIRGVLTPVAQEQGLIFLFDCLQLRSACSRDEASVAFMARRWTSVNRARSRSRADGLRAGIGEPPARLRQQIGQRPASGPFGHMERLAAGFVPGLPPSIRASTSVS